MVKRRFKKGLIIIFSITLLCGCKDKEEIIQENTDIIETVTEVEISKDKEINNKVDKEDKKEEDSNSSDINYSTLDKWIENNKDKEYTDDIQLDIDLDVETDIEEDEVFTGKVINTTVDFDKYELDKDADMNNVRGYKGTKKMFMYELNEYIIDLYGTNLIAINSYETSEQFDLLYGHTIEYYIDNLNLLLEVVEYKNTLANSILKSDKEIKTRWNNLYESLVKLKETDLTVDSIGNVDIEKIVEQSIELSNILTSKTENYDYISEAAKYYN